MCIAGNLYSIRCLSVTMADAFVTRGREIYIDYGTQTMTKCFRADVPFVHFASAGIHNRTL